jgi:hypothetical protein
MPLDRWQEVFSAFFGEGLVVRHLPCGPEHRAFSILGTLAEGPEFMPDARSTLFAKYGSAPSDWSVLAQIASVPSRPAEPQPPADDLVEAGNDNTSEGEPDDDDGSDVDRAQLEGLAAGILLGLEQTGLTAAPSWPGITITPLALYRGGTS